VLDVTLENARDDLAEKERLLKAGGLAEIDAVRQRRLVKATQQQRDLEKVESEQSSRLLTISSRPSACNWRGMTITAPFDGKVAQVIAHPGDNIGTDAPIAHLIASKRLVEAKISEEKFANIKEGQKATVRFLTYGDSSTRPPSARSCRAPIPPPSAICVLTVDIVRRNSYRASPARW